MKKTARQAFGTICIVYSAISLITLPSSLFGTKPISVTGVIVYALLCIAWGCLGIFLIRKAKSVDSPKPEITEKILSWVGAVIANALVFSFFITPIWHKIAFKKDPNLDLLISSTPIGINTYLAMRNDSLCNIQKVDEAGFTTFHFTEWYNASLDNKQLLFKNPFNVGAIVPIEASTVTEYNDSSLKVYCLNKSTEILETERVANEERLEKEKLERERKRSMFKLATAGVDEIQNYLIGRWKVRIDLGMVDGTPESICYYVIVQGSFITVKKRYCEHYRNENNAPEELVYHGGYSLRKGSSSKWITDNLKATDTDILYLELANSDDVLLYLEQDKSRYEDEEIQEQVSFVGQYGRNWGRFSRED
jgi:hypothetical protein